MTLRLRAYRRLRQEGERLGREGMSKAALNACDECDGSYKGVMILAGRLKAIAQMADCDGYWQEQVSKGYEAEVARCSS